MDYWTPRKYTNHQTPHVCKFPPLGAFLDYTSTSYGIRLLSIPTGYPAEIPTTLTRRATKYPGTDRILSLVEKMYTNRLEDRSSPSPFPIPPPLAIVHSTRSLKAKAIHAAWVVPYLQKPYQKQHGQDGPF
jgi:hypothetical protein